MSLRSLCLCVEIELADPNDRFKHRGTENAETQRRTIRPVVAESLEQTITDSLLQPTTAGEAYRLG